MSSGQDFAKAILHYIWSCLRYAGESKKNTSHGSLLQASSAMVNFRFFFSFKDVHRNLKNFEQDIPIYLFFFLLFYFFRESYCGYAAPHKGTRPELDAVSKL